MIKVLAIPDMHSPFLHRDAVAFLGAVKQKQKPDKVVCLGDEIDAHALSNYDADPDGMSAGDELRRAIEDLQPVYKMFPNVMVCTSNHTARPYRKAYKHGIPRSLMREYRDWLEAPAGWEWRDKWIIDGVHYIHGEGFSGAAGAIKAAQAHMASTVIGHLHSDAGIAFLSNSAKLIWGLNAGWLGDRRAYSMAYGKHLAKRPILGCGIVNRGMPFFLPMVLNRHGRWTGEL